MPGLNEKSPVLKITCCQSLRYEISIPYKHCLKYFLQHFVYLLVHAGVEETIVQSGLCINELQQHGPNEISDKNMLFPSTLTFFVAFCNFSTVEESLEISIGK